MRQLRSSCPSGRWAKPLTKGADVTALSLGGVGPCDSPRGELAAGKAQPPKTAVKAPVKKKSPVLSDSTQVLKIINRSRKGVDVATLVQKTAFDEKKIRNIMFRAHKDGIITRAGRGIYLGAGKKKARK